MFVVYKLDEEEFRKTGIAVWQRDCSYDIQFSAVVRAQWIGGPDYATVRVVEEPDPTPRVTNG